MKRWFAPVYAATSHTGPYIGRQARTLLGMGLLAQAMLVSAAPYGYVSGAGGSITGLTGIAADHTIVTTTTVVGAIPSPNPVYANETPVYVGGAAANAVIAAPSVGTPSVLVDTTQVRFAPYAIATESSAGGGVEVIQQAHPPVTVANPPAIPHTIAIGALPLGAAVAIGTPTTQPFRQDRVAAE